ncbi:hypothetical protein CBR_g34589 [Chara braunii]|uniref:DUF659 domain-containing protein n=1 Tax=Chara braunii TaxID=69332 RepID=A0A388LJ95_CHABU|nr:hypothetical protein CBR_g34589 [Chara braunii]|eukprot:GBG82305.1 hypothetical protein CBR_g34589 [Chara braunii]
MPRSQSSVFEDGGEDENLKAQKKCYVYKYIRVGQSLGERFHDNRMLKCVFCGHEFQGNQFVAARHFRQGKGCPEVTDEALVDIHYNNKETIVHTTDDVGADLAEVRAPFYVTGATIMLDGRKSRDARPIVNFLAGGSRGVMLIRTMNREGERDRVLDVLARWIKVFDDFPPKWVNAICTDSASAYVAAANMLQGPKQRPEHRRITWLPCAVHVCNKMLSDIGCSGAWSKDIVVRGKAVVRFIKKHGAALHIFRGESRQMGLIYPCETRFASVFAMVERLLAVRSSLERTVDGDTWGMVPWDHSVRHLARWVRWQVRHGSWWDSMTILFRVMEPVYDLLRKLDRGGLHMSRVVEWTQDLARQVAEEVCALPVDLAHHIVQRVQARCAHMLEPAHAAAHLLCPSRRDLRYFEGVVSDYDASLVREAETYILSQTGFGVSSPDYETACAQLHDFHTRRGTIAWGGRDGDRDAQRCMGNAETYESGCWWLSDSEGDEDELAGPATAGPVADERDAWSDPEDVRRRSGGDDLFVGVDLEESSGGRHESPPQRQRTMSADPRSLERERDPGFAPSRGAESGIGHRPARVRTGTASSTALPTSTKQLRRQPVGDDRLHRLVRGPRQRLPDRLEVGSSPVQGDDGDRQRLARRDGGASAGGGGGAEVAAAVEAHEIWSAGDERIPMTGGGAGFSEFGDLGMPPGESVGLARGESESRGDISVGMQEFLGQISLADPSSFSPAM